MKRVARINLCRNDRSHDYVILLFGLLESGQFDDFGGLIRVRKDAFEANALTIIIESLARCRASEQYPLPLSDVPARSDLLAVKAKHTLIKIELLSDGNLWIQPMHSKRGWLFAYELEEGWQFCMPSANLAFLEAIAKAFEISS